jgi:regulator of replication initiation timing
MANLIFSIFNLIIVLFLFYANNKSFKEISKLRKKIIMLMVENINLNNENIALKIMVKNKRNEN